MNRGGTWLEPSSVYFKVIVKSKGDMLSFIFLLNPFYVYLFLFGFVGLDGLISFFSSFLFLLLEFMLIEILYM